MNVVGKLAVVVALAASCKTKEDELPPFAATPAAAPTATTLVQLHETIASCVYDWQAPDGLHRTDAHNGPEGSVTFVGSGQQLVVFPPGSPENARQLTSNIKWRLPSTGDASVELFVGRNGFGRPVCNGQERSGSERCGFDVDGGPQVEGDTVALCQSMRISRTPRSE